MGKGDKKTRKGKIFMGSYGVTRPQKESATRIANVKSEKAPAGQVKEKQKPKK